MTNKLPTETAASNRERPKGRWCSEHSQYAHNCTECKARDAATPLPAPAKICGNCGLALAETETEGMCRKIFGVGAPSPAVSPETKMEEFIDRVVEEIEEAGIDDEFAESPAVSHSEEKGSSLPKQVPATTPGYLRAELRRAWHLYATTPGENEHVALLNCTENAEANAKFLVEAWNEKKERGPAVSQPPQEEK